MTREEARKAAEVMLAFADGKEIEVRYRNGGQWGNEKIVNFDWVVFDFRIKPNPKFDPTTLQPF